MLKIVINPILYNGKEPMSIKNINIKMIDSFKNNNYTVNILGSKELASFYGVDYCDRIKDVNNTLILNLNPFESNKLYYSYYRPGFVFPKILNFIHIDKYEWRLYKEILLLEISNYHNLFASEHNCKDFILECSKYLNATSIEKLKSRCYYPPIGLGINTKEFKFSEKRENILVYPAANVFSKKKIELNLEILDLLYLKRTDFKCYFNLYDYSNSSNQYIEEIKKRKYAILQYNLPREQYIELISKSKVFLSTSIYEGYGITYREMMYSGMIGVFYDASWVYYCVFKEYPYVFKDKYKAVVMLDYILDNYDINFALKLREYYSKYDISKFLEFINNKVLEVFNKLKGKEVNYEK